jgi:hypothetical protein
MYNNNEYLLTKKQLPGREMPETSRNSFQKAKPEFVMTQPMPHLPFLIYLGINVALGIFFDRFGRRRFPEGPSAPELLVFYFVFAAIGLPITLFVLASGLKDIFARSPHSEPSSF